MRELVHETGFADAGLTHDGNELAAALLGEGQRPADLPDLGVAADEARQPRAAATWSRLRWALAPVSA
jgi:hypothetical protein